MRCIASIPCFVVSGLFVLSILRFVASDHEVNQEMRSMANWPVFELLASTFAILLPATIVLARFIRWINLPLLRDTPSRWLVTAGMMLPFFIAAWNLCEPYFEEQKYLILFAVFSAVHIISFEFDEARRRRKLVGQRKQRLWLEALKRGGYSFLRFYTAGMVACGMAVFLVFLPMDVYGSFIESGPRHIYMSVSIGACFFLLLGLSELFAFEKAIVRLATRRARELARGLDFRHQQLRDAVVEPGQDELRPPIPRWRNFHVRRCEDEVAFGSVDLERSESWLARLQLRSATRNQIQYWDAYGLRIGETVRTRLLSRRTCLIGVWLCGFAMLGGFWIGFDPNAFEKKYSRERHVSYMTGTTYGPTRESDRNAFRGAGVFFLLLGGGLYLGWRHYRRDVLSKPKVVINFDRRTLAVPGREPFDLDDCSLRLWRHEPANGARTYGPDIWRLELELPGVPDRNRSMPYQLLSPVGLEEGQMIGELLRRQGFEAIYGPSFRSARRGLVTA